jgi:hypothetical protein
LPDFLKWLNANAAAVQAASSVVILVLTAALIYVTNLYRKDTARLAKLAAQQLAIATMPVVSMGDPRSEVRGADWSILAVSFSVYNNGQLWITVDSVEVAYWLDGFDEQGEVKRKTLSGMASAQVSAGDSSTIDFSIGIDPQPEDRRDPDKGLRYRLTVKYSGAGDTKGIWDSSPRTATFRRPR